MEGGQERWKEAENLDLEVIEKTSIVFGAESSETLDRLFELAHLYQKQGQEKKAEELRTQILEKKERLFGEKDPSTLKSMYSLAALLKLQNRKSDAISVLKSCLLL